jgi:tetratricopeptide (TPR) repeat protein
MRRVLLLIVCCALSFSLSAIEALPDWYLPLRDSVYEQRLGIGDIEQLYTQAVQTARQQLSGRALYTMFSRCEYSMGRTYLLEENNKQAETHFELGLDWAEKSLDTEQTSEGWQMLGENISQLCRVKSTGWVIFNGLKVEEYAKKALKLNPYNSAAKLLISSRWVYAPTPFNDYPRGIREFEAMLGDSKNEMDKDDRFNVLSGIGYAYNQQKKYAEARVWFEKSLELYPTNIFIRELLEAI